MPDPALPERRPAGAFGAAVPSRFAPASSPAPERHTSWQPLAIILAFVLMFTILFVWMTNPSRFPTGAGLFVIPILFVLTLFLCARARRLGADFDIGGLMLVGLALRLFAGLHRFRYAQDGGIYHQQGSLLAESFRSLNFGVDVGAPIPGTGGQRYVTGIIEVFTNSNSYATFAVFTWLAFVGCYLMYEAFVTAMPGGARRRYALLMFLWPTLVFWPSSISKDGWLLFTIGLASLGVARVLARMRGGYVLFLVGSLLASVVRPHVAMLALVAFGMALLVARRPTQVGGRSSGLAKAAGFVVLIAIGALLATQLGDFLDARDLTVDSAIATNLDKTAQGSAAFEPADPQTPLGYAKASVNILVRPFPFEADGIEQLLTSFEAIFLAGLCVASWRRLASVPFRLRKDPYVAYALAMVLMLIFVLGTIGNFGILARQRSQVMPFLFVLLCVVVPSRTDAALATEGRADGA